MTNGNSESQDDQERRERLERLQTAVNDWYNEETGGLLHKYIMRNPSISAKDQHRLFRFISDYSSSAMTGVYQYAGVHGGGSPIMEKIGIRANYDLELRKKIVKDLAGIRS